MLVKISVDHCTSSYFFRSLIRVFVAVEQHLPRKPGMAEDSDQQPARIVASRNGRYKVVFQNVRDPNGAWCFSEWMLKENTPKHLVSIWRAQRADRIAFKQQYVPNARINAEKQSTEAQSANGETNAVASDTGTLSNASKSLALEQPRVVQAAPETFVPLRSSVPPAITLTGAPVIEQVVVTESTEARGDMEEASAKTVEPLKQSNAQSLAEDLREDLSSEPAAPPQGSAIVVRSRSGRRIQPPLSEPAEQIPDQAVQKKLDAVQEENKFLRELYEQASQSASKDADALKKATEDVTRLQSQLDSSLTAQRELAAVEIEHWKSACRFAQEKLTMVEWQLENGQAELQRKADQWDAYQKQCQVEKEQRKKKLEAAKLKSAMEQELAELAEEAREINVPGDPEPVAGEFSATHSPANFPPASPNNARMPEVPPVSSFAEVEPSTSNTGEPVSTLTEIPGREKSTLPAPFSPEPQIPVQTDNSPASLTHVHESHTSPLHIQTVSHGPSHMSSTNMVSAWEPFAPPALRTHDADAAMHRSPASTPGYTPMGCDTSIPRADMDVHAAFASGSRSQGSIEQGLSMHTVPSPPPLAKRSLLTVPEHTSAPEGEAFDSPVMQSSPSYSEAPRARWKRRRQFNINFVHP